jgi:hypothetical protein
MPEFNDRRKFVTKKTAKGIHVEAVNDRNDSGGAIYQTDSAEKALKLHSDNIKTMSFAQRNYKRKSRGRNYL